VCGRYVADIVVVIVTDLECEVADIVFRVADIFCGRFGRVPFAVVLSLSLSFSRSHVVFSPRFDF
jgi:hypothetical protein